MRYYLISEELVHALNDVLGTLPYQDVAGLIANLDSLDEAEFTVQLGDVAPEAFQALDAPIEGGVQP